MIFDVTMASDFEYKGKVNINSLEELKLFMEFNRTDVIIYRPTDNENYTITVCDGELPTLKGIIWQAKN